MSKGGLRARRTAGERLAAWLVTGPLGHLYGFFADVAVLWWRWASAEARGRLERARRTPVREGFAAGDASPAEPAAVGRGAR